MGPGVQDLVHAHGPQSGAEAGRPAPLTRIAQRGLPGRSGMLAAAVVGARCADPTRALKRLGYMARAAGITFFLEDFVTLTPLPALTSQAVLLQDVSISSRLDLSGDSLPNP